MYFINCILVIINIWYFFVIIMIEYLNVFNGYDYKNKLFIVEF